MRPSVWDVMPTSHIRFALCFAAFIAFLGFLPHALFSLNVGEWNYMAVAWDEDSYTGYALKHQDVIYRTLSAGVLRTAIALLGLDSALMLMDVLLPACLALVAVAVASALGFKTRRSLFWASCLLVFALEFLGLTNSSMIGLYPSQILPFSSMVYPDWVRMFIPSAYENFFGAFRSPEPQLTYIIHLLTLYALLRHAQTGRGFYLAVLAVLVALLPFVYVSSGIALLLCMGLYAALGFLISRHRLYLPVFAIASMGVVYYLLSFLSGEPIAHTDSFVFHSRLPVISFTMLWGGVSLWFYMRHWGSNLFTRAWRMQVAPATLLGIVCALVPFITLNQQIITGQMVQSRTWEYYTNPLFAAFALLTLWPILEAQARRMPQFLTRRAIYVAPLLLVWLVVAQCANFNKYLRSNLDNLAAAQLLKELRADASLAEAQLMLHNTGDDSQIALRMGEVELLSIAGYQQTLKHMIKRLSDGDEVHTQSALPVREQAFAYFDRQGYTAEALRMRMNEAAEKAMGAIEVAYFFSYLDCWKPLSDYREQNIEGMKARIPAIIDDYAAYLADGARRNQFGEVLYVTRTMRTPVPEASWDEVLIAERTVGAFKPTTVRVYLQTPKATTANSH